MVKKMTVEQKKKWIADVKSFDDKINSLIAGDTMNRYIVISLSTHFPEWKILNSLKEAMKLYSELQNRDGDDFPVVLATVNSLSEVAE